MKNKYLLRGNQILVLFDNSLILFQFQNCSLFKSELQFRFKNCGLVYNCQNHGFDCPRSDLNYEQFLGQCIFCLETLPVIWFNHKLNLIYFRWNDEKLYQESRRIVTAEWQHVVYNEWLPIMLGQQYMTRKELMTSNNEFWICQSRIFSIKFADHFHLIQKGFFSQNQNRQKISTDVSVYAKVSLLGVDSLLGDCTFTPADWGS